MLEKKFVQAAKKNSILLANYMVDHSIIAGKHFAYSEIEKMLYVYNGCIYEPFEGIDLDKFFHDFMVEYEVTDIWKASRLTEIERAMKVNSRIPRVEMDNYEGKICFRNGVLDINTLDFFPHSPSFYFTTYVNIDYDPTVGDNPEFFLSVLKTIFWIPKKGPDIETITMMKRIGGSLLFPKNKLRQLFIFLGEGANGKSVLLNTFTIFFPKENVTYLTLEDLSKKNKERSRLLVSRLNISTEAKGGSIDAEEIKKIVYGEGVTIQRMYQEAVEFCPKTKCFVGSNSRPYFNDTTHGLARRLTVINFNNKFVKPSEYEKYVAPDESGIFLALDDDELMSKIRGEASQILNYFLIGLRELIANGWDLPGSLNSNDAKTDYLAGNDTAGTWLKETYEYDEACLPIPVIDVLADYRAWYHNNVSTKPLNFAVTTMGIKIRELFRITPHQIIKNGQRLTGYKLIKKDVYITGNSEVDEALLSMSRVGDKEKDELPLG